jgi:hypothetical protein
MPNCHTAFSWKTGLIETGRIHNPHFYQWQREQFNGQAPRVPGDNPNNCGDELPDIITILHELDDRGQDFVDIDNCHMCILHMQEVMMRQYPFTAGVDANADLRVMYLTKEIDDDEWLKTLRVRQKKAEKNHDVHQVLDMFVVTMIDIFTSFVNGADIILHEHTEALRAYTNRELLKIGLRYNNRVPHIDHQWICR